MTELQFAEILEKSIGLLGLKEDQFYQWLESMPKEESREYAKGVADEFGVNEKEFLKKLLTYQIIKAKPWVKEKDIDFEKLGI